MMNSLRWSLAVLVVSSAAVFGCGGGGPGSSSVDVGSTCNVADAGIAATDCSTLQCLCTANRPEGVCSKTCTKAADCASLGDDMSCAKDFCTGVSLCLQGYSGDKLP